MSTPLRIELACGLCNVTLRGDRREALYRDDHDGGDHWLGVLG